MAEAFGGDTELVEDLPSGGDGSDEENMRNVRHLLIERMDPDFGLLDKLLQLRALTFSQSGRIKSEKSIFDRNEKLLDLIFKERRQQALLTALTDTGQKHLSNLVKGNGVFEPEYDAAWPLPERETQIVDANRYNLLNIMDPCDLITRMFSKGVINHRQYIHVNSLPNNTQKSEALLDILRRGSEANYWKTVLCLRESNQSDVAEILEDGGVLARVDVSNEGEIEQVNVEEDHILEAMANLLQNTTLPQYQRIRERLDIRIMRAIKGQSIVFYIYCKTLEELLYLHAFLIKGEFKKRIATVFDMLISKKQTTVSEVSWSEGEFTKFKSHFERLGAKCELEERCDENERSSTSETTIRDLPLKLLDKILGKVYGLSGVFGSRIGQPTDEEIIRNMASVDYCWFQRVIQRRRFKNVIWRNLKGFYRECYKRRIICRNTRLYLEENIQTKSLLNKLRSVDCLTDIQTRLVKRVKDKSKRLRGKKEDLLHLARSLEYSRYAAFVRRLRESKQAICARVATCGGVVVKAEIQCSKFTNRKLVEQQIVKPLSDLQDTTISKTAQLRQQPNRLKVDDIEVLNSLLDRTPIVWLWCHSDSGLAKLQSNSDLVLKLLNLANITRTSEIAEVRIVNIDGDRFRKEVGEMDRLEEHKDLILDRLDPDPELLVELLTNQSLTRLEVATVKVIPDSYGRSEKLMEYLFHRGIYEMFLDALRNTQQTHLVNYILSNGERRPEFGDDWPLTEREISILDTNQRSLVDLLDASGLLPYLYSHKVINNRQRDFVSSKIVSHEKNDALLGILRRTSLQDYKKTIFCLRLSQQKLIAMLLEEGAGIVRVRSELETDSDVEDELITKFTELLAGRSLENSVRMLERSQLRLIAAKRDDNIRGNLQLDEKAVKSRHQSSDDLHRDEKAVKSQHQSSAGILSARACPIPAKKSLNTCEILTGSSTTVPSIISASTEVELERPLISDFPERRPLQSTGTDEMDLKDLVNAHKALITERLDPDFGLLDELIVSRSLTRLEVTEVKAIPHSYGRSDKLLEYVFEKDIYETFLNALRETQQTHLANYIVSNGEHRPEFGDDWPLTKREISILDTNRRSLFDLLEASDLLPHLYSHKVINNRQRDFVSSKTSYHEKNDALLEILRRTSLQDYKKMILCLRLSKQKHIAVLLKGGAGIVGVRSELETESDVNDVEDELITKLTELLADRSLEDSARVLERYQLRLIAAKGHNIRGNLKHDEKAVTSRHQSSGDLQRDEKAVKSRHQTSERRPLQSTGTDEMDLKDLVNAHKALITERLDPDFGLLDELIVSRSLTKPEVTEVKVVPDSYGRSGKLLEYVFERDIYETFLNALRDTQQTHLANYILSNGEHRPEFGDDWPLTEREISILDTNRRCLVDLLKASDLIPHLYSHKVINNRQRDFVSSKTASHEKNDALLEILRRTSIQGYKKMIRCLRLSGQKHIEMILEEGEGFVVRVRSELETESDEHEIEVEMITKLTELLAGRSPEDSARIMERTHLLLNAAKRGNP